MSQVQRKPMTVDEFLSWEEGQPGNWKFDGFAPVAVVGGTVEHAVISGNIYASLRDRLRGSPCRAVTGDLKVMVAGRIRYPDFPVVCTPLARGATSASEPVVLFEVLSESTRRTDQLTKNQEYRDTPSVQHYVMLEQERIAATVWARSDGNWVGHLLGADALLSMPELGVELPLSEFYDGVELAPPELA